MSAWWAINNFLNYYTVGKYMQDAQNTVPSGDDCVKVKKINTFFEILTLLF